MQVRASVQLMPQNQPSGRSLLLSPIAWSPDQHHAAMLVDVSRHILGRTERRGLGFGQFVRTHTGKSLKCQSSSAVHSDHSAEDSGLLGPLKSPNWVKVCLVSTVTFLSESNKSFCPLTCFFLTNYKHCLSSFLMCQSAIKLIKEDYKYQLVA